MLTQLEEDFIGDLAGSNHYLWELYQFVKLHHKEADEETVLTIGFELLKAWCSRDWLTATHITVPSKNYKGDELLRLVKKMGQDAAVPAEDSLELKLTDKAFIDVYWLNPKD